MILAFIVSFSFVFVELLLALVCFVGFFVFMLFFLLPFLIL